MVHRLLSNSRIPVVGAPLLPSALLGLFLVLSFPSLCAQPEISKNQLIFQSTNFFMGINPENGYFLVFTPNLYYELDDVSGTWVSHSYRVNEIDSTLIQIGNILYVPSEKGSYYLLNGGGAVFEFRDSSLIRIDQSFPHRNQYGGAYFFHKDKIYLYGGYGFFQHKPYMTEFSLRNPQWYIYGYDQNSEVPTARNSLFYHFNPQTENLFIAEGSSKLNPWINGSQQKSLKDVWSFNLKNRKWKKLGWISNIDYPTSHPDALSIGNKSYLVYFGFVYRIDLENNTISCFNASHNENHQVNGYVLPVYSKKLQKILLSYKSSDQKDVQQVFILKSTSLKNLENEEVYTQRFYYPKYWVTVGILLIVAIFLSILFLTSRRFIANFWRLAKQKPGQSPLFVLDTKSRTMFHQDRIIPFQEEHMDLILAFWQNGWGLTNLKLMEVVRAGQESMEALKKRKVRVLDEVNLQFAYTTQTYEPFIIEVKDQSDRRYKEYLINPVYISSIHVIE